MTLEDTMEEPKQIWELSDSKVERIEIWIDEVNSSQLYCTCSEITEGKFKYRPISEARGPPASASVSVSEHPSTSSSAVASDARPDPSHSPNAASFSSSTAPTLVSNPIGPPENKPALVCPVCSFPMDQTLLYLWLKEYEVEGLDDKSRYTSMADASNGSGCTHSGISTESEFTEPGRIGSGNVESGRVESQVKQNVLSRKGIKEIISKQANRLRKSTRVAAARSETSKGKRVLRPIRKLFGGSSESFALARDGKARTRPCATEMYHAFRADANPSKGSVETLLSSSDVGRRKPKLTIDESAARLRRASRLLKAGPHGGPT